MKRVFLPLAAMILMGGGAAAVRAQPSSETTILPGYWEYKTKVIGLTVDSKKRCVKEDEIDDFLSKPCNRHHTCVYPVKQIGGGKIYLDGYWQNKEGSRAKVKAKGTYEPRKFTLSASGTSTQGIPIGATLQAKWLGAQCPAGT